MLVRNSLGKEKRYKLILYFIVYFDRTYLSMGMSHITLKQVMDKEHLHINKTWLDLLKLPFRYVD